MDIEYDAAILEEARQQYAKAQSHKEDFEANGNLVNLDLAIECTDRALQLLPKGSLKWLVICKYYAWVLALRYEKTADMEDLTASLGLVNTWLDGTSPTNEDRAHMLSEAADRYRKMFTHSKQKAHLEQALSHGYQALSCGFENADRKFFCTREIAQMKSSMHDAFPDACTYDEMIQAQKDVLKLTESMTDFDKRFESLIRLTYTLYQRFETVENTTNAYEVLPYAREWAKMSPDTSTDPIAWFPRMITAKCLSFLVDSMLEPVDVLSEALTVLEEALAMETPLEERLQIMAEIQNVGWSKFVEQGIDIDFPEKAVQFGRKALSIVPDNHPSKPINQRDLAVALKRHFKYSGGRSLLDEAISLNRTALASRELSLAGRAIICESLSIDLLERFELVGSSHDLTEAVDLSREAVSITSVSEKARLGYLNTLQISLSKYATHANSIAELEEAIEIVRGLLEVDKSAEHAGMCYLNLGSLFYDRYRLKNEETDRIKALEYTRKRLTLTSQPERQALAYSNLGNMVYKMYRTDLLEGAVLEALHDSIKFLKKAVVLTPKPNPTTLEVLGRRQYQLWRHLKLKSDSGWDVLTESTENLEKALNSVSISPKDKIGVSFVLVHCLSDLRDYKRAAQVGQEALVTLSQLNARSLFVRDMMQNLQNYTGISSLVARAVLKNGGSPSEAFTVMERGRGLIADLIIHKELDLSELKAADKDLCDEYQRLHNTLYRAQSSPLSTADLVIYRIQILNEISQTEERIRRLPSLESFQLPLHPDTICELASEGPLICLDELYQGCIAYIVTKQGINVIHLPKLYTGALQELADYLIGPKRITKCSLRKRAEHSKGLKLLLKWLWDVAVEPVMEYLGFRGGLPPEDLPRVWWITNGLLGLMPMHAAGSGWDTTLENTASRCISSYTSNTTALALSRRKSKQIRQSELETRILALHMPLTREDGWGKLDTRKEMEAIHDQAKKNSTHIDVIEQPTIQELFAALNSRPLSQNSASDAKADDQTNYRADLLQLQSRINVNTILHLACHGDPDAIDPTNTSLLLSSPSKEAVSRLSISQLFDQANLGHIRLAYLSACCTAQQYRRDLVNENLHLGSAFQLLGCVNVIGTLWEADDTAAGALAAGFYSRFLKDLREKAEHPGGNHEESVARCLHAALAELRNKKMGRGRMVRDDVIAWACFICIGA